MTELYTRSLGTSSDVVMKEMFSFADGDDSVTLRPENTAGTWSFELNLALNYAKQFTCYLYYSMFSSEYVICMRGWYYLMYYERYFDFLDLTGRCQHKKLSFSYYFMLICKRCCSSIAPRRFATYSSTAIDVLRTHVSLWESTKRSDKTVQTVWRWVIRNSYTCRCWFNCYCLWGIASTGDCSSCEGLCNDLAIHHCGYLCFIIHEFNLMLVILLFYIYICLVFRKYTRRLLVTLINDSLLFCIITG